MQISTTHLTEYGWMEVKNIQSEEHFITIANSIGNIIKHPNDKFIDVLTPKNKDEGRQGTFSRKFGLGEFPMHTDTAFWSTPARGMLLFSENQNTSNTIFISTESIVNQFSQKDKLEAFKAIFLVKTPEKNFFTSLISVINDQTCFRYDPLCMIPFNKSAKNIAILIDEILNELTLLEIQWTGNNLLIIDNWKMLHGRASVENNLKRELKRIYLKNFL